MRLKAGKMLYKLPRDVESISAIYLKVRGVSYMLRPCGYVFKSSKTAGAPTNYEFGHNGLVFSPMPEKAYYVEIVARKIIKL